VAAVDYDYREDQLENIAAQVNRLAPQIQDDARAVQHTVRAAAALGRSGSRVRHHQRAGGPATRSKSPRQRPVRSSVIASSFKTLSLDNGTEFHDYAVWERRFPLTVYFAAPCHAWKRGTSADRPTGPAVT
jgi:IS30 family transposase